MPCYSQDNVPDGYIAKFPDGPTYESEEDCLDACAEGACCETDGTCNIKPQCECDTDNGAVFAGAGEGCDYCTPCNAGQWPFSIDVDVDVSVAPGPEVDLVSVSCYNSFKQQVESHSGGYTLPDYSARLVGVDPVYRAAYEGIFVISPWDESGGNTGDYLSWQCRSDGAEYAVPTGGIYLWLDFRCVYRWPALRNGSEFQIGVDLGATETTPPCNTREQDDVLCPCVDQYSLADRTLRGVGEIAKYTDAFVIPAQELQSQRPLENFLSGQFELQAVFPGYILGCFPSPSGQQRKTHIANVAVTIQAAGNSNPLP